MSSTIDTLSTNAAEFQMPAQNFAPVPAGNQMYNSYQQYADGNYYTYGYCAYPVTMQAMPAAEAHESKQMNSLLEALGSDQTWSHGHRNHMQLNLDDFSDMSDSDSDEESASEEPLPKKADEAIASDSDSAGAEEPDSEPGTSTPSPTLRAATAEEIQPEACSRGAPTWPADLPSPGACSEPEAEADEVCTVSSGDADRCGNFSVTQLLGWRHTAKTAKGLYAAEDMEESAPQIHQAVPQKDTTKDAGSWRRQKGPEPSQTRDKAPVKFEASENSWAAQNRARKASAAVESSDDQVARSVKSILNKLTIERFSELFRQMLDCGLSKPVHAEMLIQEVFEKATRQHHFIDMYADLCVLLHEHFTKYPFAIGDDSDSKKPLTIKRLLLDVCQASFERLLAPPKGLADLDPEERSLEEVQYKTHMLGNIKLVGALMARQMLAGKVGIAIMEELLSNPTPEALESLAALLTVVGGCFDRPDWMYRAALNHIFERIKMIVYKKSTTPRVNFLLKDVLDLRKQEWQEQRPGKSEKPRALSEVAEQQAQQLGQPVTPSRTAAAPFRAA